MKILRKTFDKTGSQKTKVVEHDSHMTLFGLVLVGKFMISYLVVVLKSNEHKLFVIFLHDLHCIANQMLLNCPRTSAF